MLVANIEKFQENFIAMQDGCEISQHKGHHFAALRNWPSTWSDWLPIVVTPSFQLQIMHHLKHWIANFPSFKTTYSMHKLSSRKCSNSGCPFECFMVDFSLLPLLAFRICLWQRTIKLQSFGSSCF